VATLVEKGAVDPRNVADLRKAADDDPWIVMKPFTTSG